MKFLSKSVKTIIIICSVLVVVLLFIGLISWTRSIESRQRQKELRKALSDVVENYGERGLLEMAGVPVNNIYYGDSGLTLFQGEEASWNYSADELQNISVFEKTQNAVVHISTSSSSQDITEEMTSSKGIGSGFFITYDGYICTNTHVITDSTSITVTTSDGTEYDATVIGSDTENDISVLKINPKDPNQTFEYLEFGDSDMIVVGQRVLAIGNPFGYDRSMVTGIISGISRPIRDASGKVLLGMIQTDASIFPGNSGGPLLNTKAQVVGINAAIYSTGNSSQGMNFAISSNTAKASCEELIKYGKVSRGWLDVVSLQVNKTLSDYAGLKVTKGLLVSQTAPLGKAEKAGIKGGNKLVPYGKSSFYMGGDVIVALNGLEINDNSDLFTALSTTKPGEKVPVLINRYGTEISTSVELVERTSENINWINR